MLRKTADSISDVVLGFHQELESNLQYIERYYKFLGMYVPRKGAVLNSFLAILSPSVAIFQMIHLALRHESKSRLSLPLLTLFLGFQPKPTKPKRPT